jgi:hypothetical protein
VTKRTRGDGEGAAAGAEPWRGGPAAAVTAIVVAEAPAPGCLAGLAPQLAETPRVEVQLALLRRAVAWALATAPGRAVVALTGEPPAGLSDRLPDGVAIVAGEPASAAAPDAAALVRAAAERFGEGPVLVAGAAWPRLGPQHAAAALADLSAGAASAFGPALDGGAYLVALAQPVPELLLLPAGPAGLPRALELARGLDHEVGLLRHERALATTDDAAAFLADPLLAPELRVALTAG